MYYNYMKDLFTFLKDKKINFWTPVGLLFRGVLGMCIAWLCLKMALSKPKILYYYQKCAASDTISFPPFALSIGSILLFPNSLQNYNVISLNYRWLMAKHVLLIMYERPHNYTKENSYRQCMRIFCRFYKMKNQRATAHIAFCGVIANDKVVFTSGPL